MATNYYNQTLIRIFTVILINSLHLTSTATEKTNLTDITALLALKSQISLEPNHKLSQNWTTNSSFCNWIGVSCSVRHNRVSALNLSHMDLQGTISPSIGNLSFLTSLDIQSNSLQGRLPETIGLLRRLRLIDVRYNKLRGNIPGEIGNLSDIETLQLRGNQFTGNFFSLVLNYSSLRILNLMENSFVGNVPDEICLRFPKLGHLYMSRNFLVGEIPGNLSQCKSLRELTIGENRFTGNIPTEFGSISTLEHMSLDENQLTGTIPPSLGNLSRLSLLNLESNYLSGEIPEELTRIYGINYLVIGFNNLSGRLPHSIFNLSSALLISFIANNLTGSIPEFNSLRSLQLQRVFLANNRLDGKIPISISNASLLTLVELSNNVLSGQVPSSLGDLRLLETLNLQSNQLGGDPSIHFLTSLENCRNLKNLVIGPNPLSGEFPNSIGNLSSTLRLFIAFSSQIKGNLPSSIGNLSNLLYLYVDDNNLNGIIPSSIGNLIQLQRFRLNGNNIKGRIPPELCKLPLLGEFLSGENQLTGSIPDCIGNLSNMLVLSLSFNALESTIPTSLWDLRNMWFLNLSCNSLNGYLPPDIEKLSKIQVFDLSKNRISGKLPASISSLNMLKQLNLSNNSLQGNIPEAIGKLGSLESLDLSFNNFSGAIPKSLAKLSDLRYLNLSYNGLSGEIPGGGIFNNLTIQSFRGNKGLCSFLLSGLSACPNSDLPRWKTLSFWLKFIVPPVVVLIIILPIVVILYLANFRKHNRLSSIGNSDVINQRFIAYNELVHATTNFNEQNILGVGSFGCVYKGTMPDGELIAVKVFKNSSDGFRSFDRECDVLRNVRHRNLLKIISSCSNLDFRALVFPFMPNGNLEQLLHYSEQPLEFIRLLNIAIDIALGIEYLHHGYSQPVVHCDLKPSNVLLDEDMVAHVADFGIAKILDPDYKSLTQTGSLGTIGYVAPEYGLGGKVCTKGDVYSYGIMLMEIFTRKKPTDEMFSRGLSLSQWVMNFPEKVVEAVDLVDAHVFVEENDDVGEQCLKRRGCLTSIMDLGLLCSSDYQQHRPNMNDVVTRLTKIKRQYLL